MSWFSLTASKHHPRVGGDLGVIYGKSQSTASATVTISPPPPIYWGMTIDGSVYGGSSHSPPYSNPPWSGTANDNSWNLFEAHTGKAVTAVAMHLDLFTWSSSPFSHARSRGAFVVCSTGLEQTNAPGVTLAGIAAGTFDTQIDAFATSVAAYGLPFMLRPWWEMNGNWYAWGNKGVAGNAAANYVAAWQRFKTRCDAKGATNITWVWCPNIWLGTVGGAVDPTPWFPGASYVDWHGIDGYNKLAWTSGGGGTSNSFDSIFSPNYTGLLALANKPIVICEIGSDEYSPSPATKAAWITDMFSKLPTYPKFKAFLWYNNNGGSTANGSGATETMALECTSAIPGVFNGTSTSTAAFATGISDSYFQANIAGSWSAGKVPTP